MLEEGGGAGGIVRLGEELGLPACRTPRQIFDAAQQGDSKALAVVEQEGYRLALAIAAITAVLDPELVVLGGGIGQRGELLLPPLERRLQQLTPLRPRIVVSKLGDESVLLGSIATGLRLHTILSSNTMSIVTMVFRRVIWFLVNYDTPAFGGMGNQKGRCWRMKERGQRGRAGASPSPTIHGRAGLPRPV